VNVRQIMPCDLSPAAKLQLLGTLQDEMIVVRQRMESRARCDEAFTDPRFAELGAAEQEVKDAIAKAGVAP